MEVPKGSSGKKKKKTKMKSISTVVQFYPQTILQYKKGNVNNKYYLFTVAVQMFSLESHQFPLVTFRFWHFAKLECEGPTTPQQPELEL